MKDTINIDGRLIDTSKPLVMAIVNVTPDSFFPGSRTEEECLIREKIEKVIAEGADIIDIGGYSSRPGAEDVAEEEEFSRIAKALAIVRETNKEIPVSIDTFRSGVIEKAVSKFGACIVNDISAGDMDERMIGTAGKYKLPYIAMHMKGTPKSMQQMCQYDNITQEVISYFARKIESFCSAGINDVILDPGFGFAKTVEQNFELLAGLSDLKILGLPYLAGVSRKTMIWKTLGTTPDNALNGTTALHWECLRQGATILRAHDVKEAAETVKLFCKFKENRRNSI